MGILKEKYYELRDEFRQVVKGDSPFIEAFLPLLIFLLIASIWDARFAAVPGFVAGAALTARDLKRGRPLLYSLGGLAILVIAMIAVLISGKAGTILLPGVGTNGLLFLLCLVSMPAKRPFVAWTSYFARHYPLGWYWHPRVRPAYSEVTLLWALFFGIRLSLQVLMLGSEKHLFILVFSLFSGWPAILTLLVISYLYGTWRLKNLGGPGVEEFSRGDPPPWKGQKRGF
ncbi:MAG TPA: DUF3159 domain-containing protein [Synergistales bacterium]|nr:DUF3159 domain-containing protein [Synergistales bacterium]